MGSAIGMPPLTAIVQYMIGMGLLGLPVSMIGALVGIALLDGYLSTTGTRMVHSRLFFKQCLAHSGYMLHVVGLLGALCVSMPSLVYELGFPVLMLATRSLPVLTELRAIM